MRARILGVALLAVAVAVTLFGVPLAIAVQRMIIANEYRELERQCLRLAARIPPELDNGPPNAIRVDVPPTDRKLRVALYTPAGQRLGGSGPAAGDSLVLRAARGGPVQGRTDGELVVALPVVVGQRVIAVTRSTAPITSAYQDIALAWAALFGLATLASGAAALLARHQARRLAAPIERLRVSAEELGAGTFAVRAAPSGIEEIDRVGRCLETTGQRLEDMLRRERTFSARASHQLRTPLTGLRLHLEAGLQRDDAQLRAAATEAIEAIDDLERSITQLLALTRGPGRGDEPLDVAAVLTGVRARWREVLAADGRDLQIDAEETPASTASAAALRQVLDVLIDNAYRHGGGTVTVTARDASGALALDVVDAGTPDAAALPSDSSGASGLGLQLARSLLEGQGGRLILVAEPGCTKATALVPGRETGDEPAEGEPAEGEPAEGEPGPGV